MISEAFVFFSVVTISLADIMSDDFASRIVSDNVKSSGMKIIYADDDMVAINQVVTDFEKTDLLNKAKTKLKDQIKQLPAEDVKCLMSVDRYCSQEMSVVKNTIIQSIKDECAACNQKQKEDAGMVVASMMAHDPMAWKLFLTRSAILHMPEKQHYHTSDTTPRYRTVSKVEEITSSKTRYIMPGFKVRVKRYALAV